MPHCISKYHSYRLNIKAGNRSLPFLYTKVNFYFSQPSRDLSLKPNNICKHSINTVMGILKEGQAEITYCCFIIKTRKAPKIMLESPIIRSFLSSIFCKVASKLRNVLGLMVGIKPSHTNTKAMATNKSCHCMT